MFLLLNGFGLLCLIGGVILMSIQNFGSISGYLVCGAGVLLIWATGERVRMMRAWNRAQKPRSAIGSQKPSWIRRLIKKLARF